MPLIYPLISRAIHTHQTQRTTKVTTQWHRDGLRDTLVRHSDDFIFNRGILQNRLHILIACLGYIYLYQRKTNIYSVCLSAK